MSTANSSLTSTSLQVAEYQKTLCLNLMFSGEKFLYNGELYIWNEEGTGLDGRPAIIAINLAGVKTYFSPDTEAQLVEKIIVYPKVSISLGELEERIDLKKDFT